MLAAGAKRSVWWLLAGSAVVLSGCFVQGRTDEGTARVQVNVEIVLPDGYGVHTMGLGGVHKSLGADVDLTETPLFVQASVEADDMARPASDSWAGNVAEASDTLDLVLELPSGPSRRLSLVAFLWDGGVVYTYRYFETIEFLDPGSQTVEAEPDLTPTWTLDGVLENFAETPETVVLQDILTGVRFPEAEVQPSGDEATFTFPDIPVGRFFYLRIRWAESGLSEPLYYCPVFFGQSASKAIAVNVLDESC